MKKQSFFLFIGIFFIFALATCNNKTVNQNFSPMNYHTGDYLAAWKTIDSLENEGLPKTALKEVNKLYHTAKKDNNPSQIIKCLMYRGKYESQLEEDGLVKVIYKMSQEAEKEEFPVKPILESMLAELYQQYLNNNRWKFRNRTETVNFKNDDIQTWTIERIVSESSRLYIKSLEYKNLKNVDLKNIEPIISKGKNTEGLRPTLYDFLAHRAIDYFKNEQTYLTQPAYRFYIDQEDALGSVEDFVNMKFQTSDITSFKYRTLLIFQELLRFHKDDKNPAALIDADLKRLNFVKANSIIPENDKLYIKALNYLKKKYAANPASAEMIYYLAKMELEKAGKYKPGIDETGKWAYKNALEMIAEAKSTFPESYGTKQCEALKNSIFRKELNIVTEKISIPNEPFLMKIDYRNVSQLFFRIVKWDENKRKKFEKIDYNKRIDFLKKQTVLTSWSVNLPDDGDYQKHSVETKVDALPIGEYLILSSDNQTFKHKGGAVSYHFVNISNLAYWHKNKGRGVDLVVVHRSTGKPISGVTAEFYLNKYDYRERKRIFRLAGKATSDSRGFITTKNLSKKERYSIKLIYGDDILDMNDRFYFYDNNYNTPENISTTFFLDRAIYRPGQTVYFKGIVIKHDSERMPEILKKEHLTVTFYDVNHQKIDSKNFVTNEYGTFNGTFTAPTSGLLGTMSIQSTSGHSRKQLRVEEYKRPKFEVTLNKLEGSYKLGDKVALTGNAKTFAGSNVDGAEVKYHIIRKAYFPWVPWWYFRSGYFPWQSNEMEILSGNTMTNEKGEFEIKFPLLPDKEIPVEQKPTFNYTINVDVVDITGETHSSTTVVKAGYVAITADIEVPSESSVEEIQSIKINTKNLSGQFESVKGHVSIQKLKPLEKEYIDRYWQKPDRYLLSKEEFEKDFPHFAYAKEDEIRERKIESTFFETDFTTKEDMDLDFPKKPLLPGTYLITFTAKDKYGVDVEKKVNFKVFDLKNKKLADKTYGWIYTGKFVFEPGETVENFIGTTDGNLHVLYEVERKNKITKSEWLTVKDLEKRMIKIGEPDRGGIFFHISYVKFNRAFYNNKTINVPWSNKELQIEYSTFRDKLKPGQDEEWRLKITGNKGEKVAAEMVAAMYDASLDQFAKNYWNFDVFPTNRSSFGMNAKYFTTATGQLVNENWNNYFEGIYKSYNSLNWFGFPFYGGRGLYRMRDMAAADGRMERKMAAAPPPPSPNALYEEPVTELLSVADGVSVTDADKEEMSEGKTTGEPQKETPPPAIRENLNETVFFMPELMTDAEGNIIVKFKMNEALTRWNFMSFAHTKDLKSAVSTKEVITQKELMIMPNPPRFFREFDEIEFTAKVVNLSEKTLSGNAELQMVNPLNSTVVYKWLDNPQFNKHFTVKAGESARIGWRFKVPDVSEVPVIEYTVIATAGEFSDGEKSAAPVLSNRMLVTETLPLPVKGGETKTFTLENMKNSAGSKTLKNHHLTLEFTSNPAWYAVQALPYLMEFPHECSEQLFSRYYANSLATTVANSHPKVKAVFDKWKNTDAMLSNLSKNQELKTVLLEETPWVLQAQSEEEQKKNIGLLFDLDKMADEQAKAIAKIADNQYPSGGWPWFKGGEESWYITQYIVEGMGHLNALGVDLFGRDRKTKTMLQKAVKFTDEMIVKEYNDLAERVKKGNTKWENDNLNNMVIHYLYARTFFLDLDLQKDAQKAFNYYLGQTEKYWLKKGNYMEGMIALALHRKGNTEVPAKIVKSLKENSLLHNELGMYWKNNTGYYWYQLPIETHALMIEVFDEVANDAEAVENLKIWLLKNKQTTHWKTTKATASAVYALLKTGENWLLEDKLVDVSFKTDAYNWKYNIEEAKKSAEAGTGYFKTSWDNETFGSEMAEVTVTNPNKSIAWGGLYWQYFEDLDKIKTFEETPLTLKKQLFRVENSPTGEVIKPVNEGDVVHPGDKLKVRIELRVDRPMEYIMMKDMRASGFEPVNVLSQYKWQGGLGYYESTRDAATNFFISYLPKGTYVFEYPLRVIHKGNFSNGITSIQCMYAPEFSSHSNGVRVVVE